MGTWLGNFGTWDGQLSARSMDSGLDKMLRNFYPGVKIYLRWELISNSVFVGAGNKVLVFLRQSLPELSWGIYHNGLNINLRIVIPYT